MCWSYSGSLQILFRILHSSVRFIALTRGGKSELLDGEQEAKLLNLSGNEALHSCFNVWENKNLVDYGFTETLYTKNKVTEK